MSNERNQITVEKIIMLMGEIAVLESRFKDHDTGNLRTAVSVLKNRVLELKDKIPQISCEAFTDEEKWMIIAAFMKKNPKLGVKALFEPDAILDLAEEYANAGIKYLDIIYEESTEPIDALEDELRKYLK